MKTYKAVFKTGGPITRIPDAQMIFGAVCQSILLQYGESELESYLHSFDETPWFVHSTMLPDGLFPAPKKSLMDISEVQKTARSEKKGSQRIQLLSEMKKYKKIAYVTEDVYQNYIATDRFSALLARLAINGGNADIRPLKDGARVLSFSDKETADSFKMKGQLQIRSGSLKNQVEKDLFYQKQLFLSESSQLVVYIKSNISEEKLASILSLFSVTGIGPSHTVGLNLFHLEGLQEYKPVKAKRKGTVISLLSDCIPGQDEFNYAKSSYGIVSTLNRGSYSYVKDAYVGRFNALEVGSLLEAKEMKDYYGRNVCFSVNGKAICHYGIGFVL